MMSAERTCGFCGGEIGSEVHYNASADGEVSQPFCSTVCAQIAAEEVPEEVVELRPVFTRHILESLRIQADTTDPQAKREGLERIHKEQMRAAFLTNDLATEEDFERLYPRLRDEELCEHARIVFRQTMERLSSEFDAGLNPETYTSGDGD